MSILLMNLLAEQSQWDLVNFQLELLVLYFCDRYICVSSNYIITSLELD